MLLFHLVDLVMLLVHDVRKLELVRELRAEIALRV